ncbi:hypothetical protein MRB53_012973 [Persea americana]|uniref:Uncharacterized protein n=1 Tax=Persea americana TaxID=3435 RepID=A0ACC2M045_PERAE|nr:hypothetical protein MRB53_012973 [Persea americana]
MVTSSIASGFSLCRTRNCVLTSLCFFRFCLSVGIGGDYPLSSLLMAEMSCKETRGSFIAAVFSMQGFGILAGSAVTMIVTKVFDQGPSRPLDYWPPEDADLAWRSIVMFGAIPAVLTFYWRMVMPGTPRYTALVEGNIPQAVRDAQELLGISLDHIQWETPPEPLRYSLFSKEFLRHNGRHLFGCAASWMLIDIVFYSITLFQSKIYESKIGDPRSYTACGEAFAVAKLQAIMAACSTIPGYWAAVFLIDRIGRVKIQMMAKLFPAQFRSTSHGLSGAFGKVGAIIGSIGFIWGRSNGFGMQYFLIILGGICLLGCVLTYFYTPETNDRSLEDNESEEEPDERPMMRRSPANGGVVSDQHSESDSLETENPFHTCPTSL